MKCHMHGARRGKTPAQAGPDAHPHIPTASPGLCSPITSPQALPRILPSWARVLLYKFSQHSRSHQSLSRLPGSSRGVTKHLSCMGWAPMETPADSFHCLSHLDPTNLQRQACRFAKSCLPPRPQHNHFPTKCSTAQQAEQTAAARAVPAQS